MTETSGKLCECGCGEYTGICTYNAPKRGYFKGEPLRFVNGHSCRGRRVPRPEIICAQCGMFFTPRHRYEAKTKKYCGQACVHLAQQLEGHPNYKGGLCFAPSEGRWLIWCRDGTQMKYARGVMAAQVGRLLREDEHVHHVNEEPADDRPENLEILTPTEHAAEHARRRARLSDEQVREIREAYARGGVLQRELAARFGIAASYVSNLVTGAYRA